MYRRRCRFGHTFGHNLGMRGKTRLRSMRFAGLRRNSPGPHESLPSVAFPEAKSIGRCSGTGTGGSAFGRVVGGLIATAPGDAESGKLAAAFSFPIERPVAQRGRPRRPNTRRKVETAQRAASTKISPWAAESDVPGTSVCRRRGQAEYFGIGRIGEVWPDPSNDAQKRARDRSWHCVIEDYYPFAKPVAATDGKGRGTFETIPTARAWRTGARVIAWPHFARLLGVAGIDAAWFGRTTPTEDGDTAPEAPRTPRLPDLEHVSPVIVSDETLTRRSGGHAKHDGGDAGGSDGGSRRSSFASLIGRHAERIVMKWLRETLPKELRKSVKHVADRKPGWDVEYVDAGKRLQRLEVKATCASALSSFELTAREREAAESFGEDYVVVFVTECATRTPKLRFVENPHRWVVEGRWTATPTIWQISLQVSPGE